ncbi:MAG: Gfo/Idh/MocA family oxidoreductase [Cytophagales bacterium]|nr:Gfo/Idh/MocA family oxidoreductase [Cytophagales bacterium]
MKSIGIIGGGMIAALHAQAIQAMEGAELAGAYIRKPEQAAAFAQKHECPTYTDLDEFLHLDQLDMVTIATPSGAHLDGIKAAVIAGKHVICEKPLEITPDRVHEAQQLAKENGVLLGGIFNRRFNESVTQLKTAIEAGRFGQIITCEANIKWSRDQAYYDSGAWRGTWELDGGGTLMNQSIHTIDLLIYFLGIPKRLTASVGTLTHRNIEVEDTAMAMLEFENGSKGVIQGSTSIWSTEGNPAEIHIYGSKGAVILADEHFRLWDFKEARGSDTYVRDHLMGASQQAQGANDPKAIKFQGHQKNFENFVAAVEGKAPLNVDAEEALKPVALINAIYESARSNGKWVEL